MNILQNIIHTSDMKENYIIIEKLLAFYDVLYYNITHSNDFITN